MTDTGEQWFKTKLRAMLHSFSLSRVSYKGEFYLERFLMRQHCINSSVILILLSPFVAFVRI